MHADLFQEDIKLSLNNVLLVPLSYEHEQGLIEATKDGELWNLRITSAPHYSNVKSYIETALKQKAEGSRFPFVVIEESTGKILGTSSYHDILMDVGRYEIGYTWYAQSVQRTHVNTTCKLLLLEYAFERLDALTVGLRTDQFNFKSQRAIERLGAKKDGVIRGHALRKDGTIRDTVMYSIIKGEWSNVKAHLQDLLASHSK
ncbi:N-acetyltransferase [Acinetobacter sp. WCHAc060033]|uniref:GNAT family N-acetyltransferase n=1 Tax=Acinetobacter sp. WCHAc060033 TaxID=2518624 RepID=UPI0010232F5B|nr:GNAT family protein [Acinetobacter sp. WCHAc060033]RZG88598.1 N-acetyltransferase [Acinetobacter sp. WCHAc060033]